MDHIGGVMMNVLVSIAVDGALELKLCRSKD